jgi:thiol-disulfide isomerase/thioredoxin
MTKFVNLNQGMNQGGDSSSFLPKMSFLGGSSGLSSSTIFYIVIAILLIILAIYLYYQYVKPATNPNFTANSEYNQINSGANGSGEAELMFFYADWCPHCKTAKPIWEDLKSEYENKKINGYTVMFTEVNCTNETPEIESLMNKYKIEGFPTIKLLKDGQIIEYDAKPSKTTLVEFLNTAL